MVRTEITIYTIAESGTVSCTACGIRAGCEHFSVGSCRPCNKARRRPVDRVLPVIGRVQHLHIVYIRVIQRPQRVGNLSCKHGPQHKCNQYIM